MKKRLFLDIDHTVLDFNAGLESFLARKHGIELKPGWLGDSCRLYKVLGITEEHCDEMIHDFFLDEEFADLRALPDAAHCLPRLEELGWKFVAISACPTSIPTELRKKNLEERLGVTFEDVHHTGYGACKADILRSYEPAVWVEDNAENASVGHELGYRSFLLNRSYNILTPSPAIKVADWYDILVNLDG